MGTLSRVRVRSHRDRHGLGRLAVFCNDWLWRLRRSILDSGDRIPDLGCVSFFLLFLSRLLCDGCFGLRLDLLLLFNDLLGLLLPFFLDKSLNLGFLRVHNKPLVRFEALDLTLLNLLTLLFCRNLNFMLLSLELRDLQILSQFSDLLVFSVQVRFLNHISGFLQSTGIK